MKKKMDMVKNYVKKETWGKTAFTLVLAAVLCSISTGIPAYAAGSASSSVATAFGPVYQIIAALVSCCGQLFLLWGVFEWAIALNSSDGTMQAMAFKRIAGGLVACLAPSLIPLITKGIQNLATLS